MFFFGAGAQKQWTGGRPVNTQSLEAAQAIESQLLRTSVEAATQQQWMLLLLRWAACALGIPSGSGLQLAHGSTANDGDLRLLL